LEIVLFQKLAHFAARMAMGEGFVVTARGIFAVVTRGCITKGIGILRLRHYRSPFIVRVSAFNPPETVTTVASQVVTEENSIGLANIAGRALRS
jgi:hypothetical protein